MRRPRAGAYRAGPGRIGVAGMLRAIAVDSSWIGVGPDPSGIVSAT